MAPITTFLLFCVVFVAAHAAFEALGWPRRPFREAPSMIPTNPDHDRREDRPEPGVAPPRRPFAANPAGLAPSGSHAGSLNLVDAVRTFLTGFGVYGLLVALSPLFNFVITNPSQFPRYWPEIAAFFVALTHLVKAFQSDNTPKAP